MKQVLLSQNREALVDDEDYERVSSYKWSLSSAGYAVTNLKNRKQLLMHRLIMNAPSGTEVDHRNFDRIDNRKGNLAVMSRHDNNKNRLPYSNNKSGYKGVSAKGKGYRAAITVNGHSFHLGYFLTAIEAARVYNEAAVEHHGEFARLNEL